MVVLSGLDIWTFVLTKLVQLLSTLSAKWLHIFTVVAFQVSRHSSAFLTMCKENCYIFKESLFIHFHLGNYLI